MNRYRSCPRSLCGSMRSVYHRVGAGKHRRRVRTRRWGRAKVHVTGRGRQRPSCCCRRIVQGTFTCPVHHAQGPQACSAAPSTKPLAARGSPTKSLPPLCLGRSGRCWVMPGDSWAVGSRMIRCPQILHTSGHFRPGRRVHGVGTALPWVRGFRGSRARAGRIRQKPRRGRNAAVAK